MNLSIAIEDALPSDPPGLIPRVDYSDHVNGAKQIRKFFPGLTREHLPGGSGWAVEHVYLTTQAGTHLDAPYHYAPTMDHDRPALTVDEIPLEWCFHDDVLLDFRHKADGETITVDDIEGEVKRINYEIKPMDIVLIQTGADSSWTDGSGRGTWWNWRSRESAR